MALAIRKDAAVPAPHPAEFRLRAVELARARSKLIAELARELGISELCLRDWLVQAEVDEDGSQTRLASAEKNELTEFRRDKRRLELEVEVLKRAAAYFARENVLLNWSTRWSVNSPMMILMSRWPAGYWRCQDRAIMIGCPGLCPCAARRTSYC
jgi:transposase